MKTSTAFRIVTPLIALSAVAMSMAQGAHALDTSTLYGRLGGVHKIAAFAEAHFDLCSKNKMLLKNERFAGAVKNFPAPAVKFFLTGYFGSKTGGMQMAPMDIAAVDKWFMFSPDQRKELVKIDAMAVKKAGIDAEAGEEMISWYEKQVEMAKPMEPTMEMFNSKSTLYARLGGMVPISMVVDTFVNKLATDKTILSNPNVVKALTRGEVTAIGIKYLVTEQLCAAAGGPFKYSGKSMKESHKDLMITEKEWDASAKILVDVLNMYKVPQKEQGEILNAIVASKGDIVRG